MVDSNASGFAALSDMIARCRSLEQMPKESAPKVAELLRGTIAQSIAAQQSPEGQAWKPTADGSAPLQGAMSAITVVARGTMVIATLAGHHVFHQRGRQSNKGRALQRAAGAASKAARSVSGAASKLEKKIARASAAIGSRKTEKARQKAADKVARLSTQHAELQAKEAEHTGSAKRARAAHAATVGVGGLPARPMIPQMLSAKFGFAIRELYKKRWEAITGGAT